MDVADHQRAARRFPLRRHARALGTLRHAGQSDAQPGAGHRAMRRGLRRQRRHRRPDLPLRQLAEQLGRRAQLARVGVARHWRAQPQVRPHLDAVHRRPEYVRQQPEPDVSRQQRRAERRHGNGTADGAAPAHRLHGALRAGAVDDPSHDAAGRAPLRSLVELLRAADTARLQLSSLHGELSGDGRRQRLQGSDAAPRRRIRRVRQRQDRAQSEPRASTSRRRAMVSASTRRPIRSTG